MSLERHGDFAPIMLTNEPDETDISSGKLLPKDRRNSSHVSPSPQE
ncbi:hypothetical protein THF1A12_300064 [Vibrio jasicida]|uniref:Uncharacterized protein n=1 Tax=Vibrio jasicida TaxID=766224 RepID=A0AAU9QNX3_9VIBR|nr:hypothetical protein THF1A12_300064 [Vibrio jasicida]